MGIQCLRRVHLTKYLPNDNNYVKNKNTIGGRVMAKQSKKQIIAEAFEILTAPGGTCDPYADNIGIGGTGAELKMRESIWYVLTDLVAEDSFSSHPVLSS